jgi:hypothetical protein
MNEQKRQDATQTAPSTVGMTIYGILVTCQRPFTMLELDLSMCKMGHPYTYEIIEEALKELVSRGRINFDGQHYSAKDKLRRPAVLRNHDDVAIDPVTKKISGGWEGWVVKELPPDPPTWPIEEVIK